MVRHTVWSISNVKSKFWSSPRPGIVNPQAESFRHGPLPGLVFFPPKVHILVQSTSWYSNPNPQAESIFRHGPPHGLVYFQSKVHILVQSTSCCRQPASRAPGPDTVQLHGLPTAHLPIIAHLSYCRSRPHFPGIFYIVLFMVGCKQTSLQSRKS
jgi:hypothetical protein